MRAHLQANGSPCTSVSPLFGVWTTRRRLALHDGWPQMQGGAYPADDMSIFSAQRMHHVVSSEDVRILPSPSLASTKRLLGMLALILSAAPSLHTPGVNARLSSRANARSSSARMITLVDEVDEKAMLVRRASHA